MQLFHDRWPWRRNADGLTVLEVLPRWLRLALGTVLIALTVGCMMIRTSDHDPARWHVDPLTAERTGKPNDHLAAPEDLAAVRVDRALGVLDEDPAALMARWHAVAVAAPRVTVVAGAPGDLFVTYVQRSAVFGFPDYVSVRAVAVEGGASLAIWARARYGYSDLGVNAKRVGRWLAALEAG